MDRELTSPYRAAILAGFVALLSYLAAAIGGALSPAGSLSPLWPGCAFVVAVLLCTPRKIWPALIAAGLAGFFLYDMRIGLPLRSTGLLLVADTVEILVASLGVGYTLGGIPRLNSIKRLALYSLFAVLLAPALGAFIGAVALGVNYWIMWRVSFFSEALALLTLTPAILGYVNTAFTRIYKSVGYYCEAVMMIAGLVVLGYFIFIIAGGQNRPALLYSLVPFLLWSALRFGTVGTCTSMLVVAFLSIWGTVHGGGLFNGSRPFSNVLSLQLFLLFAAVPFTTLAALVEERRGAEQALRDSEAHAHAKARELEAVLDAVPVAVLISSDIKCERITANRTGCELFRLPPGANASKSAPGDQRPTFRILIDGVEVPTEELPIQRAAATAKEMLGISETVVFEDGTERKLISNAVPLIGEDGRPYGAVAAMLDVTERHKADKALRESESRFRTMADTAPVLIWMSGPDKLCTYFNKPWLDFTGRSIDSELGKGWADGVYSEDLQQCLDTYTLAFDRREEFRMEYRLRRHDGEYRWVLDIGVPRFSQDRSFIGYIGVGVDVTERKLADETLASVNRKLIEAQERERARIARELHDDVCQRLALLSGGLEQLPQVNPTLAAEVSDYMDGLKKQISEIASSLQSLSHELHSSNLEYLGLVPAIRGFCREFGQHQNVQIDFNAHDLPSPLPPGLSLCLFRVLQEALHNSVKHSGVRHSEVQLWAISGEVHLMVKDSGLGFDSEAAKQGRGLGLVSMQERLKLLNGTLAITSQPMQGTIIHARVPLSSGREAMQVAG